MYETHMCIDSLSKIRKETVSFNKVCHFPKCILQLYSIIHMSLVECCVIASFVLDGGWRGDFTIVHTFICNSCSGESMVTIALYNAQT